MSKRLLGTVVLVVALVAYAKTAVMRTREEINEYREYLRSTVNGEPTGEGFDYVQYPWENSGKFEGDIVLTDDDIEALVDKFAGGKNALVDQSRLWPNKIAYYWINTTSFTDKEINSVNNAITALNTYSCLKLVPRTNETAYIRIRGVASGCSATVGYTGSRQDVSLAPQCVMKGVILHEILHGLGFHHQQSTYNRDDWVAIMWDKISPGMEFNFNKYNESYITNLNTTYDYGSVMHYSQYAFSVDGNRTIIPIQPYNQTLGSIYDLTSTDKLKLNRLYQCPGF